MRLTLACLLACAAGHQAVPPPVPSPAPVVAAVPPQPPVPASAMDAPAMQMARVTPAVIASDDTVIAIGGENAEGPLRTAEIWSGERWRPLGRMQIARVRHSATRLADGRVLIAGGAPNVSFAGVPADTPDEPAIHDLLWDHGAWKQIDHGAFRVYHTATLMRDGSVLVYGGVRDSCGCCKKIGPGEFTGTIERFDPRTDEWTVVGRPLVPRDRHGAAALGDGSLLVFGGESVAWGEGDQPIATNERWRGP